MAQIRSLLSSTTEMFWGEWFYSFCIETWWNSFVSNVIRCVEGWFYEYVEKVFNWSQISECNLILKLIWHIFFSSLISSFFSLSLLFLTLCLPLRVTSSHVFDDIHKASSRKNGPQETYSTIVDELCILFWQVYMLYTVEWNGWAMWCDMMRRRGRGGGGRQLA